MLYITGETRISTLMRVRRVCNLHRIKNLPEDTQLKKIYDQEIWHAKGLIFHTYEQDEELMHNVQNKTSVSQQELNKATNNPPSKQTKKIIQRLHVEAELAASAHRLRVKHSELLECINPTNKQPLLERSSLSIARHVRWLFDVTDALCDQPLFTDQSDK